MQIGIVFQSNFQEFPSPTTNLITWIMQPYLPDTWEQCKQGSPLPSFQPLGRMLVHHNHKDVA